MTRLPDPAEQWIGTLSGRKFCPLAPQADAIEIEDIATVLSRKFRFTCHSPQAYSVGQHSLAVADRVPHVWALLHDAAETWLPDVPSPIKANLFFWVPCEGSFVSLSFAKAEERILEQVARRFNLTPLPHRSDLIQLIKNADDRCLATERRDLFDDRQPPWPELTAEPYPETIIPGSPTRSAELFLDRFEELRGAAG